MTQEDWGYRILMWSKIWQIERQIAGCEIMRNGWPQRNLDVNS